MFPFVVSMIALMGATALSSVSYSYIRITPSAATVVAGERFYIDIHAVAHVPVNAVDITLSFKEDNIEVLGVDTGQSVITLWTEEPRVDREQVILRGGTFQRGFRGEHLIARVSAQAKQPGQTEFLVRDLQLLAGDGRGTPVLTSNHADSQARVTVVDEATQDDPQSLSANVELRVVTDIDGDGTVSLSDVSRFLSAWHGRTTVYDFNEDGKMTFRDFAIILADSFLGTNP
jgi:hypothetical protein